MFKKKYEVLMLDDNNYVRIKISGLENKIQILEFKAEGDKWDELFEQLQNYREFIASPILAINILKFDIDQRIRWRVHGFRKVNAYRPWEWWWCY